MGSPALSPPSQYPPTIRATHESSGSSSWAKVEEEERSKVRERWRSLIFLVHIPNPDLLKKNCSYGKLCCS